MSQANPKDGILLAGVPLSVTNPGKVFWVNNSGVIPDNGVGGSDLSSRGTYLRPFATIDYAVGKCTASRGDVIMLMPGHAENVATNGAIEADVAGVAIVGLGSGSLTPKISATAAAGAVKVTAANVSLFNIQFEANFADCTNLLNLSDVGADYCGVFNCKFTEAGTDLNFLRALRVNTTADYLTVDNCTFVGSDASNDNCIAALGTHIGFVITNNRFAFLTAQTAGEGQIEVATKITDTFVAHNHFYSATAAVDNAFVTMAGTANTGWAAHNFLKSVDLDADAANFLGAFDVTGLGCFENYAVADADANGVNFLTDDNLS